MIKSKYLIIIATIALFLGAGVGASGIFSQTATSGTAPGMTADASYQATGIEPNPTMNTNVTWSTFYNGWKPLEYSNGSANLTLQTNTSSYFKNPTTVNESGLEMPTNYIVAGLNWTNPTNWKDRYSQDSPSVTNTSSSLTLSAKNTNLTTTKTANYWLPLPIGKLPSVNPAYDYITVIGYYHSTQLLTNGGSIQIVANDTNTGATNTKEHQDINITHEETSNSPNGYYLNQTFEPFFISTNAIGINLTNAQYIGIGLGLNTPPNSTAASITITNMMVTTYQVTLGTSSYGPVSGQYGNAELTKFDPNFKWTEIKNNGYTVATSQPLQNITTSQSSVNTGNYIEQVTYQGTFSLPTAPDLSYSNTNTTMPVSINGNQFIVANLNGVSYTSTLNGMKNGTLAFGNVNPNNENTIVLEVDYTASQWNSVSQAPSFWSDPLGAIEYYWYITLGVLLGAIGLETGIGAKYEGFRVRK